jgi:histidine kinase
MIFSSVKPTILCIENPHDQPFPISEMIGQALKEFELISATSGEEGMKSLERLVLRNHEVAMVISEQNLIDNKGHSLLVKAYEKWPHAVRMLLLSDEEAPDEVLIDQAKVFRVFEHPFNPDDFKNALRDAARFYKQRQELAFKSHVLTELHRASMTLIGERRLDKLLHKLMRIVIENADALNGYIILERESDQSLFIEAEGHIDNYETTIRTTEVNDFSPVCPAIVEYSRNTRDNVILHDALNDGLFTSHPYVRKNLSRSIICTPLIYQGQIYGLLYLDNNQKTNAFSPLNIELFRLLSAPAAIAIENARLYQELESKVENRTREVIAQKQEIERTRDELQMKNNDIMDSIRYAKRIQDAILPNVLDIKRVLPKAFVYFSPKDVVSGDFYWFSKRLSKVIIAAADCTGHGIPGAFMTVMANTLLKQIVELEGIFKPCDILYHLNLRIRVALQQDTDSTNKDGLEIAICQIDPSRRKLQFAGANRPLILIRNNEITELKGDKYGIGGDQEESSRLYTNQVVELEDNDVFYIYSDGYPDQIGEEINKKFLSRRFYSLLTEIHLKDPQHQRMLLDAELRHWRGDKEQTDDITVIGIQI